MMSGHEAPAVRLFLEAGGVLLLAGVVAGILRTAAYVAARLGLAIWCAGLPLMVWRALRAERRRP
jgi:type IV secretory pathway TrbD component